MKRFLLIAICALALTTGCKKEQEPEAQIGLFSIAEGRQVRFSQGNLQYQASTNTWRFAEHQYDCLGGIANAAISATNTGWIDLFGFATSGYNNCYPYLTSTDDNDYCSYVSQVEGSNYDWGLYNSISNGGNQAGLWRCLTLDEFNYIQYQRADATNKFGTGRIQTGANTYVNGLFLLPDNWTMPAGLTFNPGVSNSPTDYSKNTYTIAQWTQMESAGAIFLPAAGIREETNVIYENSQGYYWLLSNCRNYYTGYAIIIKGNHVVISYPLRHFGQSVRLVQDVASND